MLATLASLVISATPAVSIPFERYTLPNGLTVILHEDHRLPTVTVNVWYRVGSADEAKGRTGFAHLFEHLMFMGTKEVPNGQFNRLMEQAGGINNATTSEDRTNYFEWGPSNLLETFLYLEADRLAHLPDDMTKAKVDLQRDVVKNERRQSYENRPYGMMSIILSDAMFPASHPYHHPVIGSHADLTAASVDDVKNFFKKNYVPANASLVIAGDFVAADAKKLVEKYFAPLARVEAPVRAELPIVELKAPVRLTQKDDVQAERVYLAWLAPPSYARGDAELELLAIALGQGKSSRLEASLVRDQKLATGVSVALSRQRGQSVFLIDAVALEGHTGAELEKALEAELEKLRANPITAEELSRARALVQVDKLSAIEQVFERADLLNQLETELGDPSLASWVLVDRFDAVSTSDVAEAVRRVLGKPRVTLTFVPKNVKAAKGGAK
ncbi:MAG: pitrilysin family protein [Archangium sp.]